MDKPSVYIETSIVSYLAADPSRHPVTLRNQQLTHAWWETRDDYALYTSRYVLDEAARGDREMARRRLALLAGITPLASLEVVEHLARTLCHRVPLPPGAEEDANHIAISAANGIRYLVTWNCKHIANPRLRPRVTSVCTEWDLAAPLLCTPADLLEVD